MIQAAKHHSKPAVKIWGWAIALAGSIALNIILFGLMPGLIQQTPALPEKREDLKHIQVIRVKKVEPPLREKSPLKIVKPRSVEQIKQTHPVRVKQKKILLKPRLKFELNPELPPAPMDLVMPSLEHFSMAVPILKEIYDIEELDTGLTVLVRTPPIYPVKAQRRDIQGFVTVEFTVTIQGLVKHIKILESKPKKIFNNSVLNCVSRWKFTPPTVEGIPVSTRAVTTIRFKLDE